MSTVCDLSQGKCKPCEGGVPPVGDAQAAELLKQLDGWSMQDMAISKTWRFKDYHEVMAFVNAAAWISHREGHHPDLIISYNTCTANYTTHAIGGLSENDFICAAKLDALFKL